MGCAVTPRAGIYLRHSGGGADGGGGGGSGWRDSDSGPIIIPFEKALFPRLRW